MDALIKQMFFNENILIESMFWLKCNQDESFYYFVEKYLDEVIAETGIENFGDVFKGGEIYVPDIVRTFHFNNKFGFLCRVGFPTLFDYLKKAPDEEEYRLKVIYGDTLSELEDRILLYHYKFKQVDVSAKTKKDDVATRRNNLKLVKG